MKKAFAIYLLFIVLPTSIFAQKKEKLKDKTIFVSTALNIYPYIESYSFFNSFNSNTSNIDLTFLTSNSGTFILDDDKSIEIERLNTVEFPSQLLNIGASVQVINYKGLYQELSLTKLSFGKSSYQTQFVYEDSLGNKQRYQMGYKQKTATFRMRYEVGKYFGKKRRRRSKTKFGLAGGIETALYAYKRTPISQHEFPIQATIFSVELSIIPMLSFQLSKKVELSFKLIPNFLVGDFENIKERNPLVPRGQIDGSREYDFPEIHLDGSVLFRYKINEPKKKRRRK